MKLKLSGTKRYPVDLSKFSDYSISTGGWLNLFKLGESRSSACLSAHGVLIERVTNDKK